MRIINAVPLEQAKRIASKARIDASARLVVYTAVIGNYDDPPSIDFPQSAGAKFICISDREMELEYPWIHLLVDREDLTPRAQAKIYKLFPHVLFPKIKASIWIDGTFRIKGDMEKLADTGLGEYTMAAFRHPSRKCAYAESRACLRLGKETKNIIKHQMGSYKAAGFKKNEGLIHGGVLLRKHNENVVIRIMEDWWAEQIKFSMRDQLSFNFIAYMNNFVYNTFDAEIYDNRYLDWTAHKNPSKTEKARVVYWFWLNFYRLDKFFKRLMVSLAR